MGCHTWFFRPTKEDEKAAGYCEYSMNTYNDNRYTNEGLPHNLFRIGGYPDDVLKSLDETLEYINKNHISYYVGDWELKLTAFWDENPDGIIEFG